MPFPDFIKALAEKKVGEFCEKRVPLHVRHKVNLSYKVRGDSITIIENRPPWRKELTEWTHSKIAQFRYNGKKNTWTLYCADRNSKWRAYKVLPPVGDMDKVFEAIDRDSTGIFWG